MVDASRQVLTELVRLPRVRRRLAEQVSGLDVRYGREDDAGPAVGARYPLVTLPTPDGPREVAELLRPGHGVLLTQDPALADLARPWAGRVATVRVTNPIETGVTGPDGTLAPSADALLLRPDGHVAWSGAPGTAGDGLGAALRRWFGEPTPAQYTSAPGAQNTMEERP